MGGFIFGKSFHTFHNRTHKTSPPIPSGRWCWLFVCCACHAFGGCRVNLLPGLAWKNACSVCCMSSSFQVSPASSSPSSFPLPKWEASAMSGGDRSCRHPVNKLLISLSLASLNVIHTNRNKTARTHTYTKLWRAKKIWQNISNWGWRLSKVQRKFNVRLNFIFLCTANWSTQANIAPTFQGYCLK